jgi:hypothetical protein
MVKGGGLDQSVATSAASLQQFWRETAISFCSITRPACIRLAKTSARPFVVAGALGCFSQKPA